MTNTMKPLILAVALIAVTAANALTADAGDLYPWPTQMEVESPDLLYGLPREYYGY